MSNATDPTETALNGSPTPTSAQPRYENGVLYYIKARNGEVNVARYFARHHLFYAVGDAIGYFPDDLAAIGKPVPLDHAFDE